METPLLAAALIIKDEERVLPRCLASLTVVSSLVSEICIYDTGSTDRSIEIAEAAGATVQRGYWDADFARARNEAIAMTSAKWVLIIDADEELRCDAATLAKSLRAWLSEGLIGFDAVQMDVVNTRRGGIEDFSLPSRRILRPSRAEYRGVIHETIESTSGKPLRVVGAARSLGHLVHHGYAEAPTLDGKGERNSRGGDIEVERLEAEGADDARMAQALVNRARSLTLVGNNSGAARDFYRARKLRTDSPFRRWAGEDLAQMLMNIGAYDDAAVMIRQIRSEGSDTQMCDWLLARARTGQGRHSDALDLLRGIDKTINAVGIAFDVADVLRDRMFAAARCGQTDEAVACGVAVMAGHGRTTGLAALLVKLWGGRSPELLAQLLYEADRGHHHAVAADLREHGGEAVAAALDQLHAPTGVDSPDGRAFQPRK